MIITNLNDFFQKEGYNTISNEFRTKIELWESWYKGKVDSFHSYKVYNGKNSINCTRLTLSMAKKVCEDWAGLLMNEKVKITLSGKKEQLFLNSVLADNNFLVKANEAQEKKAAYGTVAYVPYLENVIVDKKGRIIKPGKIRFNYIPALGIFPLSWDNSQISECAFVTDIVRIVNRKSQLFKYVQLHIKDTNGLYVIKNVIFLNENGNLQQRELNEVPGFETISPKVFTNSKQKRFVIDRLNICNNIEDSAPMGISVFANSIDILKAIDTVFDSYNNEFVLGKRRIMVKEETLREEIDGTKVYDPNDVVFYQLPGDANDENFIEPIEVSIRANEHELAMQNRLNLLSSSVGLGDRFYRFDSGGVATATQVISENSTLFRTLKKHEIILQKSIVELVKIVLTMGKETLDSTLNPDIEVTIDFDDSIIEDKAAEYQRDKEMLSMGILRPEEFRAKYLNEDLERARANLPEASQVIEGW